MNPRSLAEWLERQQKSHPSAIDLDLTRVAAVADRLGLRTPEHQVFTVGGTNGKGSTVSYLDSILRGAGLRVGRFTSPHLVRYNERVVVDGAEATDAQIISAFERIEAARGDVTLTFFEYNTLAALEVFSRARLDVAVLEVGLGGRLDATNIVDADVSILCSIGIDHVEWLGATRDAIGREKAGIFRRGRPAVLGTDDMPESVWQSIRNIGALAVASNRDFHVRKHSNGWDFSCNDFHLRNLSAPALIGGHQYANAAAALAAICVSDLGVVLESDMVSAALRDTRLPGRFQRELGAIEWIFDVAHNVDAAEVLASALETLPSSNRTIAVCGMLGDKDVAGVFRAMSSAVDAWILVPLLGPRAVDTASLAGQLPSNAEVLAYARDVPNACDIARQSAQPGDRVIVFGSFLTVGPALEYLGLY